MSYIAKNNVKYGSGGSSVDIDVIMDAFYGSVEEREVLAQAITEKGVEASAANTLTEMAEKIGQLPKGGTAAANEIVKGKTAWVEGELITGTKELMQSDSYKTTYYMYAGTTYDHNYTFPEAFSTVPNVVIQASISSNENEEPYAHCWVTSVTKQGFSAKVKCTLNAGYTYYYIKWYAWV